MCQHDRGFSLVLGLVLTILCFQCKIYNYSKTNCMVLFDIAICIWILYDLLKIRVIDLFGLIWNDLLVHLFHTTLRY